MKRFARSTVRRIQPKAARPRRQPIDRLVLLALAPGPISQQIEADLDASREALTEAGFGYVGGFDLDVDAPPEVWSRYLSQPWDWWDEVEDAVRRLMNRRLPTGATGLVVSGESLLGAEPWGPADRLRLRPSAVASLAAWTDFVPAHRTTVVIASLDPDVLRSELADGLGGSGAPRDRETIQALTEEWPDLDDLMQRIQSEGYDVVQIPVDLDVSDRIRFFEELSELLGVRLEMPNRHVPRSGMHRATVRATAALGAAIGTGDLLTDDEVRSLGTFLNRRFRSKFDSDVAMARRRRLSTAGAADPLLETPVMRRATSPESAVALNPRPRLLLHASPPPISAMVEAHLSAARSQLRKHNIVWLPIDQALADPDARGWYSDGYEQGHYRSVRADLLAAAEREAEALGDTTDITWVVTIDLGKEPSPRGESARLTRSLGARIIDIMDALKPASCSIMAQLVRPDRVESPPGLSQDRPIWSNERPKLDYEALARGLLTIPAVDVHIETVDTPSPDYASALRRLSVWMGMDSGVPSVLDGAPHIARSARAMAVALLLEQERYKDDTNVGQLDAFLSEIGTMILDADESEAAVAAELAAEHRANLDTMFLAWLDRRGNPYAADDTVTTSST